MRRYMLDTNTASYFIKEKSLILQHRLQSVPLENLCVSVLTEAELLHGLAKLSENTNNNEPHKLIKLVQFFLMHITILPWDSHAAITYANFRPACERQGKSLSAIDMLIAAHSLSVGACLISSDKAFFQLADILDVEDWTKV